jgi:hypothetical protein
VSPRAACTSVVSRGRSSRHDVVAHRRRLAFHFMQSVLNDIADRHDADDSAAVATGMLRNLPDVMRSMRLGFALVAGLHLSRHRLAYWLAERSKSDRPWAVRPLKGDY